MRSAILVCGLALFCNYSKAQIIQFPDLIVTANGDSIRCTIRVINNRTNEVFVLMPDSLKGIRRATYKPGELRYYNGGFYKTPYLIPPGYRVNKKGNLAFLPKLEPCFLYLGIGPGRVNGAIQDHGSQQARQHLKKLRLGIGYYLDFGAYFIKYVGLFVHVESFAIHARDKDMEDNLTNLDIQIGPIARIPFRQHGASYLYGGLAYGMGVAQSAPVYHGYEQSNSRGTVSLAYAAVGAHIAILPNIGVHAQVSESSTLERAHPLALRTNYAAVLNKVSASAGISLTF